jgi:hypothetical protein
VLRSFPKRNVTNDDSDPGFDRPRAHDPAQAVSQTISFSRTIAFDGVTVTVSSSFTVNTTAKTLTGTTTLTVVNSTTGKTILSKTFNIDLSFGISNSISFMLAIAAVPLALAVKCSVDVTTHVAACVVTRDPDINLNGSVDIGDFVLLLGSVGTIQGSPSFNPRADLNADGKVDITDALILIGDLGLLVR